MIMMDLRDVLRDILGSYRVQFLLLRRQCTAPEASALDFLFRDRLYEDFDYVGFASGIMALVPEDNVIDYKDDFGLHYLVLQGRDTETGAFVFCGPFTYRTYGEADYEKLLQRHHLQSDAIDAIRWYFKRIPVIQDYLSWQHMFSSLLSRYLANPDLAIQSVSYDHPEQAKQKPSIALSSIPYTSIEARYAVENAMLEAIRRGDIPEAIYQQNLFMGFTLDQRVDDPLQDAKYMVIAANTAYRKAIEQAAVHPLYIDGISGQFVKEIEAVETIDQLNALIPQMIRHYCLLVQQHSMERYSAPVRDCLNYIDFHYMEPINLEGLATRFVINKNYLSSRFHKEVGATVTDYINKTRIRQAEEKLAKTTLSMQAIAEQCGFSDANYFTRTFKKINGISPNEYRKSLNAHLIPNP
ncbi:MAG: helix-turn-helix domain-containing protein [Clostridia bacterium]|nr:helix-turn-helix domain-containing protein [Clostridia bacterium]